MKKIIRRINIDSPAELVNEIYETINNIERFVFMETIEKEKKLMRFSESNKRYIESDKNVLKILVNETLKSIISNKYQYKFDDTSKKLLFHDLNGKKRIKKSVVDELLDNLEVVPEKKFHKDTHVINTLNGVLDFITGEFRQLSKKDYFCDITNANFLADYYDCPTEFFTWSMNLLSLTKSYDYNDYINQTDVELKSVKLDEYIYRERVESLFQILGYFLTGNTSLKKCFFFIGNSNTGKTTFITYIQDLMGTYGKTLDSNCLIKNRSSDPSIKSDPINKRNCRGAFSNEMSSDQKLNDAFFKELFGGNGEVSGRRMRRENVEFDPLFKLLVTSNELPQLSNLDDAILNRLVIIKSINSIPEDKQDPDFLKKMQKPELKDKVFTFLCRKAIEFYKNNSSINIHKTMLLHKNEYALLQTNIVSEYIDKCIITTGNRFDRVATESIFNHFLDYLKMIGYPTNPKTGELYSKRKFQVEFKKIVSTYDSINKVNTNTIISTYSGLKLIHLYGNSI